jgi:uncharacterized membrane protein
MDYRTILFWVSLAMALILLVAFFHQYFPKKQGRTVDALTADALFCSIIMIMGFVPQLGYITIVPGLSLTLLHIPVLIGAYLFGTKRGTLYGFVFGLTSWFQALQTGTGFNAFFIYPWVSVLPRILFGFLAGLFFTLLKKMPKIYHSGFYVGLSAFVLTIVHTLLVFLDLFIFYPSEMKQIFATSSSIASGVVLAFVAVIALGAIGEATLAGITTPLVGKALRRVQENSANK